jgi:microcystin-dependent protein
MPRNGSGSMSLTTTFVASTPALASDVNTVLGDIADEITNSVAKDGQTPMTGALKLSDGSASLPGLSFSSDTNTGIYRISSDTIGIAVGGAEILRVNSSGITLASGKSLSGQTFVPSGAIMMWSGTVATIPSGWYLCDGTNSTPDLRDKFVIGARQDDSSVAKTNVTGSLTQSGGSKDAVNVSHTHTATVTDPGHSHDAGTSAGIQTGYNLAQVRSTAEGTLDTTDATTGITVAISTEGSSGTNANLPPYYALAFIMKA